MLFLKTISRIYYWAWRVYDRLPWPRTIRQLREELNDELERNTRFSELIRKAEAGSESGTVYGNRAQLLMSYNLSRMKLMETGGFLDVNVDGLATFMGVGLGHPKAIRDQVLKEFGSLGDDADRMLTGDIYQEGDTE